MQVNSIVNESNILTEERFSNIFVSFLETNFDPTYFLLDILKYVTYCIRGTDLIVYSP